MKLEALLSEITIKANAVIEFFSWVGIGARRVSNIFVVFDCAKLEVFVNDIVRVRRLRLRHHEMIFWAKRR